MKARGINKGDRCPESIGGCRRQPGVRRLPVKLWLFDSRRKSGGIFYGEYD